MADVQAPKIAAANVTGAPLETAAGVLIGVGQYLGTQGIAMPHDASGWVQFLLGILIAAAGAFVRLSSAPKVGAVVLAFLFGATAAHAQAIGDTMQVAAGNINASYCSGCSPEIEDVGGILWPMMEIPSSGGVVYLGPWRIPNSATSPNISLTWSRVCVDGSCSGNVCDNICCGAIGPNVSLAGANLASCTATTSDTIGAQWVTTPAYILGTTLVPNDTSGSPCSGTGCNGYEIECQLQRVAVGSCASGSSNTIGYTTVMRGFQ